MARVEAGTSEFSLKCSVYHAELMKFMTHVVWVDDETNLYCVFVLDADGRTIRANCCGSEPETQVLQAKKIEIHWNNLLIVINPIADDNDEALNEQTEIEEQI